MTEYRPDLITRIVSSVIGTFSPQKAIMYQAHRYALKNYAAGKLDGANAQWSPSSKSVDADFIPDKQKIINRCRETARNDMFVSGGIKKICTNVVRGGQKFQVNILKKSGEPAEKLNKQIEKDLIPATKGPALDISGHDSIYALQRQVLRACWVDGQIFARRVWVPGSKLGFKLKMLKSDQLDTSVSAWQENGNVVISGIEFYPDSMKPAAYHFIRTIPDSFIYRQEPIRVDAKDIIHVFDKEEADQTQGVPWIATIVMEAHELKEFRRYESIAARVGSAFAIFQKQEFPDAEMPNLWNSEAASPKHVQPGTIQKIPWGTGIEVAKSDRPSSSFAPWVEGSLQGQSAGFGLSYSSYSNDRKKSSYSSERSGAIAERFGFQWQQGFLNEKFNLQLWQWIIEAEQIRGLPVSVDEHGYAVEMQSDGWPWVDPKKDAEAAEILKNMGATTLRKIMQAMGYDYEETRIQRKKEVEEDFTFLTEAENEQTQPSDDVEPEKTELKAV